MKFFCIAYLFSLIAYSQQLTLLNQEQKNISFRGLSVVNENIFWVAGSKGMIGKTTNGGKSFQWMPQKKYSQNEFRDIEAFEAQSAYVMAITRPASILKTTNGGRRFKTVYKDTHEKAFLDAMSCTNFSQCIAIGDAVHAHELYVLFTKNSKWKLWQNSFKTQEGEAFFAASGTNIQLFENENFIAVSGGQTSRIMYRYKGFNNRVDKILEWACEMHNVSK